MHDRDPEQIQASKEEIGAALNMREHDRVDENSPADADHPASYAKSVALRAHFRREDLCRDEECSCAPGRGVNEGE